MIRTIQDFRERWLEETESTIALFNHLTDDSLGKGLPGTRSIGRLANHLVETLTEFPHNLGLPIEEKFFACKKVDELIDAYRENADRVLEAVAENWDDATLEAERNMYGQTWKNGLSLYYLIAHQVHHRAQATILMRYAGLTVPGMYGPSREEWKAMNMAPLE